jgi:predicted nuclease of predicted toxin-antitoxin system
MRFLIDAQLPPALARWLSSAGHDAEHVADIGLAGARDGEIWAYALSAGAVIVSKDEDFALRKILHRNGPSIVWIRLPNSRRSELLTWFATALPKIVEAFERGESFIELI